ncbi:MAG: phosphoribosylformylglycinamidine cyclo-ligase [bacterium]|nr:phosphoribosylformylglycinamidine cyclo-ligase [bacterium]
MTYRAAGVDVAGGDQFVCDITETVRATQKAHPGRVLGDLKQFAGMFHLGAMVEDPVLISGTDGVGTKLIIAQELKRHRTIGIDLVAMCMNDVLTAGAIPLFFLDYLGTGRIDAQTLAEVVEGIGEGCRRAGCVLLGGETAEMPDFYEPGVYDLSGCAVGVVSRRRLIDGTAVRTGDVLIGLPSSGLHSNGYSLVRRILPDVEAWKKPDTVPELGTPLAEALLAPTEIYAKAVAAVREIEGVHGLVHITGGGVPGNLSRIIPEGGQARLDPASWERPPIFSLIAGRGPVEAAEMYRTFNMGLGFVMAVAPEAAAQVEAALGAAEVAFSRIGEVHARGAGEPAVRIEGIS